MEQDQTLPRPSPWIKIAGLLSIAAFVVICYQQKDLILKFADISLATVAQVSLVFLAFVALTTWLWRYSFQWIEADIDLKHSFVLLCSSMFIAYIPLQAVLVFQMLYLKKRHGVNYTPNLALLMIYSFIGLSVAGIFGLIVLAYIYYTQGIASTPLWFLFATVASIILIMKPITTLVHRFQFQMGFKNGLAVTQWMLDMIKIKYVTTAFVIMLVLSGLACFRYYLLAEHVPPASRFETALVLPTFIGISRIVPLAPAGLGVNEAAAEIGARVIGLQEGAGFSLAVLDRAILFVWKALLGGACIIFMFRDWKCRDLGEVREASD